MMRNSRNKKLISLSLFSATNIAVCCLIVSLGCSDSGSPKKPTNQKPPGQANHGDSGSPGKITDQKPLGQANQKEQLTKTLKPTIKLLEPGAEPRTQLRYSLQAETSGSFTMDMSLGLTMETEGIRQDIPMPHVQITASVSCKESTPDGGMPIKVTYDKVEILNKPGIPPELLAQYNEIMGSMQGMITSGVMTPQGLCEDVDLKFPENFHPELKKSIDDLKQTFNSFAQPFPKVAIGKGARWQVSMPFTSEGIKGTQVSTLTLKDIRGDKVKMEITTEQTAPVQEIDVPEAPGGKGQLLSYKSTGTGKSEGSLTGFSDTKYELNETRNQTLSVNGAEMKMTMKQGLVLHP